MHAIDCQKDTINTFHALGMSISYDIVVDVRRVLALAVSKRLEDDGVVVPSNMKWGVFATGEVYNIDESGRFELHGTAITLTNHPTRDNIGVDIPPLTLDVVVGVQVHLPKEFALCHT